MNNKIQIGRHFERKGVKILEDEGYNLIQHTSSINPISPYDLIVEKDGIKYFIEIRGRRTSKKNIPFYISRKKRKNLLNLGNVKILIINNIDHKILDLKDKPLVFYIEEPEKSQDTIKRKTLKRYGNNLVAVFTKEEEQMYGLVEGDVIDIIDDMLVQKTHKKKKGGKKQNG